jgi:hypothetical protein
MKTSNFSWLFVFFLALIAFTSFGADGTALPSSKAEYWTLLIAAVTPLIIGFVNWFVPRIPPWMLPASAPVVGILLGLLVDSVTKANLSWVESAALGGLGVFVREVFNQTVTKRLADSSGKYLPLLFMLLVPLPFFSTGCTTSRQLDPSGVYAGDQLLWQADQLIVDVDTTLTEIESLAARNPEVFSSNPKLKSLLEKVKAERDGTPKDNEVLTNLIRIRDAYAVSKSAENATTLQKSFVVARAFLTEVRSLLLTK